MCFVMTVISDYSGVIKVIIIIYIQLVTARADFIRNAQRNTTANNATPEMTKTREYFSGQ